MRPPPPEDEPGPPAGSPVPRGGGFSSDPSQGETGESIAPPRDAAPAVLAEGPAPKDVPPAVSGRGRVKERLGERLFRGLTLGAAVLLLVLLVAIALFLLARALPAINQDTTNFLTTKTWLPDGTPPVFGIAALTYGTLVTSVVAVIIAVPVAVGVALSITQYVPRRFAQPVGYVIDLLAAVPSVVYGLWGLIFLVPAIMPLSKWLSDYFGWIPIFTSDGIFGKSLFTASVVLAIMILPIIAAISREVFALVPTEHKEAAYALGAGKWGMIRMTVLPYGWPGIIGASVLGFGRAMGETIAVALVLSANYETPTHILTPGGNTIAANIANTFGDAGTVGRGALIASGLVLFAITLVVNFTARAIVNRRKDFRGAAA